MFVVLTTAGVLAAIIVIALDLRYVNPLIVLSNSVLRNV